MRRYDGIDDELIIIRNRRKVDVHGCALIDFGFDKNKSLMLVNDGIYGGQSQSHAFFGSQFLGGVVGIKYSGKMFGSNSLALVLDH